MVASAACRLPDIACMALQQTHTVQDNKQDKVLSYLHLSRQGGPCSASSRLLWCPTSELIAWLLSKQQVATSSARLAEAVYLCSCISSWCMCGDAAPDAACGSSQVLLRPAAVWAACSPRNRHTSSAPAQQEWPQQTVTDHCTISPAPAGGCCMTCSVRSIRASPGQVLIVILCRQCTSWQSPQAACCLC